MRIMFRASLAVKLPTHALCPIRYRLRTPVFAQICEGSIPMSAFEDYKDELEHFEQMFGRERGRLAVSLDRLTNALVLVGQHGVYCTSQRNPAVPAMDIRIVAQELAHAKELVQSVMEELRQAKESAR